MNIQVRAIMLNLVSNATVSWNIRLVLWCHSVKPNPTHCCEARIALFQVLDLFRPHMLRRMHHHLNHECGWLARHISHQPQRTWTFHNKGRYWSWLMIRSRPWSRTCRTGYHWNHQRSLCWPAGHCQGRSFPCRCRGLTGPKWRVQSWESPHHRSAHWLRCPHSRCGE